MTGSFLIRYRRLITTFCHLAIITVSLSLAFLLRFDFSVPQRYILCLEHSLWIALCIKALAFHLARLDRGWWRYAEATDLVRILAGNVIGSVAFLMSVGLVAGPRVPRSIFCIDFLLCFLLTVAARFSIRLYRDVVGHHLSQVRRKRILIYGAGDAGIALAREIHANPSLGFEVVGFLDDDRRKWHADLAGVPVLGSGRQAPRVVDRYKKRFLAIEEIIIAMPSATGPQVREALANCRAAGVSCKITPGIAELLTGNFLTAQIRDVSVADLLGRPPNQLDEGGIRKSIAGHCVLITGGAGSIGSELARQIAKFEPRMLVILDQAESELYKIELELKNHFPRLRLAPQIGDIRDVPRVEEVIGRYSVDSIFHAAAYKHVPMMEAHVLEAVQNNVIGTWNLVQAARRNEVSDFLMISSDKAVNPTSIMGVTKRVAELIVAAMPVQDGRGTKFVSVRFGNVLGSNGSVVPLFQAQIAAGGPVTVTHPDVRRYFMTIPEAVQLVLQAQTMGRGSEIYVLDMGEPIRIVDLARNMIRLAGFVPEEDIEIRFVGLRPGEKLVEELTCREDVLPTSHEKIRIFRGPSVELPFIESWVSTLQHVLDTRNEATVIEHLRALAPEFQSEIWARNRKPAASVQASAAYAAS